MNKADKNKKQAIPIVYSCNDKHSVLALVSMTSIMENTKADVEFIILYSDLNEESVEILSSIKKYNNCSIIFQKIDKTKFKNYTNVFWVTVEGWYRILIPELFPEYNKVVYLDCDTLLNGDISEFYNNDISNVLLGATKDVWGINQASQRTKLKDNSYFNSGVLLINSQKWREKKIYEKIDDYVQNNEYSYGDQDVLNYIICDDKILLSTKYNYLEGWWDNYKNDYEGSEIEDYKASKINPLIIHFTGPKPNTPDSHHSMKELWWKYARKTFCYDVEQEKKCLKEIYNKPLLNYNGIIPICYIVNESSAVYTLTSLVSILENTKNIIDVTIIDTGIKEETKKIFNFLKYENCNIRFIEIDNEKIPKDFPLLDYLIFKINDFAFDFDKVIFLKNTTLLNGNLQELFNYDISNVMVAAVQDVWNIASSNNIQLGNNNYFSCGVMLLNVEKIKKANLINKAIEYQQNNANASEQDILNKIINEDKILISPRYNYMETWWTDYYNEYKYNSLKEYEKAKQNPLIIHFTGYLPDNVQSKNSFGKLWWLYLKKTDFYTGKLEEFRLNFYQEKNNLEYKLAVYKNKFKEINDKISD